MKTLNFALIGAAGYIAPKHMGAIKASGHHLVAATDPHDSVGVLDSHFPACRFFTEIERFDRHLEKLRRTGEESRIHYVSICTPNYLHDAHVRLALRLNANAICEKPLVINPWNLDALLELETEHDARVYTIFQLRYLPAVQQLRAALAEKKNQNTTDIELTYVTRRGTWYDASWKTQQDKSGGLIMNIGIHFFDLLSWLFGPVQTQELHLHESRRMSGFLQLEQARVKWFLSIDDNDLPDEVKAEGGYAYRSLKLDGEEFDLSAGFTDLHTKVYEETLAGRGLGIEAAKPSIQLVYDIRHADVGGARENHHPWLKGQA
jgi:UDP-N-acetyl-2-amino-2-deoxyglucuronate dehydrogenase